MLIYKYKLNAEEIQLVMLRGNVLSAGVQGNDIMIWAEYEDHKPEIPVHVTIAGTGNVAVLLPQSKFVNTVFVQEFVFHIFATPHNIK